MGWEKPFCPYASNCFLFLALPAVASTRKPSGLGDAPLPLSANRMAQMERRAAGQAQGGRFCPKAAERGGGDREGESARAPEPLLRLCVEQPQTAAAEAEETRRAANAPDRREHGGSLGVPSRASPRHAPRQSRAGTRRQPGELEPELCCR